jgi:hypothetical protein
MPMSGRKPKPEGQKRHRVPPTYQWIEVVHKRYTGPVPELPEQPRYDGEPDPAPEPKRLLGREGRAMWERVWADAAGVPVNPESLLVLCEQMDERCALRVKVLRDHQPGFRTALRILDQQIASGLAGLKLRNVRQVPRQWPRRTLRWWDTVSHMPHCVLWDESDWEFAVDTAHVAAAFHAGDARFANELRQREKHLGVTMDSRRDLRIRYVDAVEEPAADSAVVTAMDAYRRAAGGPQPT